ncbi:hypothetical protein M2155_002026 [Streptomyces sp. SAI-119]|uniref:hypothetical protein n=1 Tax=Streptomyces sp. SAI-119 TaxID=2940541 RepID=UPI002473A036|nr:hypothetical protein [Streptomyces sp. SAI-119]MDH6449618.1 hypothetical protein [Streptomyces sp. SAI-119]
MNPEHIPAGAIGTSKIPDGAIQSGDALEDIRKREPYAVEAVILHALAKFSMGGPPMGKDEARKWLGLYLRQFAEGRSPVDPGVQT